ncbi:MAG TPA: multidrug ABC transporter ATP-binding protein [Clostridiales bacterium]|nr:multidrug ABC transporter ATP-binding protein [Clostridiales bacterium]
MARTLEQLQKQYNRQTSTPGKGMGMRRGPMGPGGHGSGMSGGKPKNSKHTIRRLFSYISVYKFRFIWVFLSMGFSTVTSLLGAYMLSPIINRISGVTTKYDFADKAIVSITASIQPLIGPFVEKEEAGETIAYLITGIFCLAVIYILNVVSTYVQSKLMLHVAQNSIQKIRNDLFQKVQSLPVRFHDTNSTGEIMSRFTNDVDNIGTMLNTTIVSLIAGIITLVGTFCFMLYTNVLLTIITVIFIPVYIFGGAAVAKKSRKYAVEQQAALGAVNGYTEESVSGQKVVKVFNHENECIEEFSTLNNDLRSKQMHAQFWGGVMAPIFGNISQICYALTAGIGGILCFLTASGSISPTSAMGLTVGGLTIFATYSRQFARPINEISMQMTTVFSALAGAERVFNIMDKLSEEPDSKQTNTMPAMKGYVILDQVTFGYEPKKTILKNISLYAKPGQKIAFVGSTGAGKTTITNLLNRFYDIDNGTITIDGANIKDIKRDVLRQNIAMVLQDTHLFTGTIRENIRYGRLDATEEEVEIAAQTAHAHSFIMRLEHGYDTIIEGDGSNLSQGQRQLLNIARAAISKAPILVLDEATSSVDTRTERNIEKGMDKLMEDRTTFVIAHRLSTVRNANAILVLEKGEIIERGSHEDLLQLKGRYYELYTGLLELD